MHTLLIAIVCVSVIIMLTRFWKRYLDGVYKTGWLDPVDAFVAHFILGLLPIVSVPFLIGQWLHERKHGKEVPW